METQTQNQPKTMWQRSEIRRFFAWLFTSLITWRRVRRCLFVFAVLVTLIAVAFTIENIRGKRIWDKYRAQMAAQGENLDWKAYVPKPIPDDQNFAATPYLVYFMQNYRDTNAMGKKWPANYSAASLKVPAMRTSSGTRPARRVLDLAAYAAAFEQIRSGKGGEKLPPDAGWDAASRAKAAGTIIERMKPYQPVMDELRQVSSRPGSRFNLNYEQENPATILLPHLVQMKSLCQAFRLHASAELAVGNTDQAFHDIEVMLRISEAIQNEAWLISYLVRVAMFRIATDAIWEGLLEHKWNDAQLQQFQARLEQFNFVAAAQQSLRAERAFSLKYIEFLRTCSRNPFSRDNKIIWEDLGDGSARVTQFAYGAMPSGWLHLEKYHFARLYHEICFNPANPAEKRIDPARARLAEQKLEASFQGSIKTFLEHSILSRLLLPALGNTLKRTAETQAVVSQVTLACALERYRLAKGEYPEQLAALTPIYIQQLPHDPITGSSLIYQKNEGEYILYSVAWDGKDDGGLVPKTNASNKPHDWVWASAAHLSNR